MHSVSTDCIVGSGSNARPISRRTPSADRPRPSWSSRGSPRGTPRPTPPHRRDSRRRTSGSVRSPPPSPVRSSSRRGPVARRAAARTRVGFDVVRRDLDQPVPAFALPKRLELAPADVREQNAVRPGTGRPNDVGDGALDLAVGSSVDRTPASVRRPSRGSLGPERDRRASPVRRAAGGSRTRPPRPAGDPLVPNGRRSCGWTSETALVAS